MLALADPAIDTGRMFNVQWYVVERLNRMGYEDEEFDDAMAYNTRAQIEWRRHEH